MTLAPGQFNRQMTLGNVAEALRLGLHKRLGLIAVLLALEGGYLWISKSPGVLAYAMIATGTWSALSVWCSTARGLPLLPVFAIQTFVVYALPIIIGHEILEIYPAEMVNQAALEVLIFISSLALVWRASMGGMRPGSPYSYALQGFNKDKSKRLRTIGFSLVAVSTAYQLTQATGSMHLLYAMLPAGSTPIVNALTAAVGMCGFFLLAMVAGSGGLSASLRATFWILLAVNCIIIASGFLLSAAAASVGAVSIGLLWSTGRFPWRYFVIVISILAFFNAGKFVMRQRYWKIEEGQSSVSFTLSQMPGAYLEWANASWQLLTGTDEDEDAGTPARKKNKDFTKSGQSILERVNNLQNILFVISAVEEQNVPTLSGASYAVIPSLLIPRLFWPDKPRTHEGQIMLNVHFGRQDMNSTRSTYIAWGFLAEAYGNFGPYLGAILLGASLGIFCAWIENFTCHKLVLSLEGFVCFALFSSVLNSYEMVMSVFVTATFQSIIPICLACLPFVELQRSDDLRT